MKKLFTVSLLVILLIVLSSSVLFAKETVVVQTPGGTFEIAQRKIMEDFEKENDCTVLYETLLSVQSMSKLRVEKDDPILALAFQDEIIAVQAIQEGLYDPLDVSKLSNFKDVGAKFKADHNKFVAWFFANELIAYNSDYVKDPPKSWEDLWDPKYKGKIILPDITTSHGMSLLVTWALLNGVSEKNIE